MYTSGREQNLRFSDLSVSCAIYDVGVSTQTLTLELNGASYAGVRMDGYP